MFLNIVVSIGCAVATFHSYKPTERRNYPLPCLARKKININNNIFKKIFKTNVYMHNTKGDVALVNISREKTIPRSLAVSKIKVLCLSLASVSF